MSIGTPHSIYHPIYQAFATYLVRCEVDFRVLSPPSHIDNAKMMQTRGMKACFLIPECSLSVCKSTKGNPHFPCFPRSLAAFRGKTGKKSGVTGKIAGKKC